MPDTPLDPEKLPGHAVANRDAWNADSDTYQADHGPQLKASGGMAWGVWQMPEKHLQVLGDVKDQDILEFGCGAAQWSISLAKAGARPVALDLSEKQLEHARKLMIDADVDFPILHASAEEVPLPDESFDIVFCDYGAMTFGDPYATVPEAARLLRPGGLLLLHGFNPESVVLGASGDGLQARPLPPEVMRWLVEARGFYSARIARPVAARDNAPAGAAAPRHLAMTAPAVVPFEASQVSSECAIVARKMS